MKVEVIEYQSDWPNLFTAEAEKIRKILGEELVAVFHIGSTAVTNLKAKPIIDMMPVVKNITMVDNYNQDFVDIGYEPMGEFGIAGRRYFRKGSDIRTHQIHIFEMSNSTDIERHLAVRDYLRANSKEALTYGELKSKLAKLYPDDIESYCDGKDEFVKLIEKKAIAWHRKKIDLSEV